MTRQQQCNPTTAPSSCNPTTPRRSLHAPDPRCAHSALPLLFMTAPLLLLPPFTTGGNDEAMQYFNLAIELHPDNAEVFVARP